MLQSSHFIFGYRLQNLSLRKFLLFQEERVRVMDRLKKSNQSLELVYKDRLNSALQMDFPLILKYIVLK